MANNFNDLAEEFGVVEPLRPHDCKDVEVEWSKFVSRLDETIAAGERGAWETAPMYREVWQNGSENSAVDMIVVGYGLGNYWFAHGIHGQRDGIAISENTLPFLKGVRTCIAKAKPAFLAKFHQLSERGKAGIKKATANNATSVVIPSTLIGNLELFRSVYRNVIKMVEMTGELDYDYGPVHAEWDDWCRNDRAYAQVGLNLLQFRRT